MAKKFKKSMSVLLAVLLVLSVTPLESIAQIDFGKYFSVDFSAFAASEETFTDGRYTYTVKDDKATITVFNKTDFTDTQLVIPEKLGEYTVTAISSSVFAGIGVEKVTLPEGLTEINHSCFKNCTNLDTVVFPSTLKTIYHDAFNNCKNITSVTLNEGLKHIGYGAFAGTNITEVTIPKTVVALSFEKFSNKEEGTFNYNNLSYSSAFNNTPLKKVTIEEGNTDALRYGAFKNCTKLEEIIIPESITEIGNNVFEGCEALTAFTIPNTVKTIYPYAFYNCTNLNNITFKEGLKFIGYNAFSKTAITDVELPVSIRCLSFNYFSDSTESYYYFSTSSSAFANSSLKTVTIANGNKFALIDHAFRNCKTLETVNIPDSLTEIGNYVFYGCEALTTINGGDNIDTIGKYAFYGCTRLKDIFTPPKVESIAEYTYGNCTGLTNIEVPSNIVSIFHDAFNGCSKLTHVKFNDGLNVIGYAAFNGTGITTVSIPKTVYAMSFSEWIDETKTAFKYTTNGCASAFYGSKLQKIIIEDGNIQALSAHALKNCTYLTEVVVSNTANQIGDYVFYGCTSLKRIDIPESINKIGKNAFEKSGIEKIYLKTKFPSSYRVEAEHCTYTSGSPYWNTNASSGYHLKNAKSVKFQFNVTKAGTFTFYENAINNVSSRRFTLYIDGQQYKTYTPTVNQYTAYADLSEKLSLGDIELEEGLHEIEFKQYSSYTVPEYDYFTIKPTGDAQGSIVDAYLGLNAIGTNAFNNCQKLSTVYFQSDEKAWNKILIPSEGNTALLECNIVFNHEHDRKVVVKDESTYVAGNCITPDTWYESVYCSECEALVSGSYVIGKVDPDVHASKETKVINTKEPTCKENGYTGDTVHACCEALISSGEPISNTGINHTWDEGTVTTQPKCTEKGVKTFKCTICDAEEQRDVNQLGHLFTKYVSNNDATCISNGTKTAICDRKDCNAENTIEDTGTILGHLFTYYVSNNDATCIEDGTKTAVCDHTGCNEIETIPDTGSKLGHKFTNYVPNGDATCVSNGTKTAVCDHDGCNEQDTKSDEDTVGSHDLVTDEAVPATCEETGLTEGKHCSRCDYVEPQEETKALGHLFTNYVSDNNATCTVNGTKTATCDHENCDETDIIIDEGSMLAHDLVVDKPAKAATCLATGLTEGKHCKNCTYTEQQKQTSALGHKFVKYKSDGNATCTEDGTKSAKCERCTATNTIIDTGSAMGHNMTMWQITKQPTESQRGIRERYCQRCDYSETESFEKYTFWAKLIYFIFTIISKVFSTNLV